MTRRSIMAVVMLGSTLAACHRADDGAALSARDRRAAAAINGAIAANSTAAKLAGLPVEQPRAAAFRTELPPGFLGRWGQSRRDCDPKVGDPTGLLVVEPDRLRFYTGSARIAGFDRRGPRDVVVRLDYKSSPDRETRTELKLGTANAVLTRIERSPTSTVRYQPC